MLLFAQTVELAFTFVAAIGFIKGLRLADRYALLPRLPNGIAHTCDSFLRVFTNGFNSIVPDTTSGVLATVLLLPTNPDIAPPADSKRDSGPIDDSTHCVCRDPLYFVFHCLGGVPEAVDIANDPVDRFVDGPGSRLESPELGAAAPAEGPVDVDLATRSSESGAVSPSFGGSRRLSPSCAIGEATIPAQLAAPKAHLRPMKSYFDAFVLDAINAPIFTVLACFALVKSRDILKLIASFVDEPRVTASQLLHVLESAVLRHDLESVQCLLVSMLIAALLGVGSLAHDIAFLLAAALTQSIRARSARRSVRNSVHICGTMLEAAVSAAGERLGALPTRFTLDMLLFVGRNIRTDTLPFTRKPSSPCGSEFANREEYAHSWSSGSVKDSDLSSAEDSRTELLGREQSLFDAEDTLSGSPKLDNRVHDMNDGELSAMNSAVYDPINGFDDEGPMGFTSPKIDGLTDPSSVESASNDNLVSVLYDNIVTCQTSNGTDRFRPEATFGIQSIDFDPVSFQCSAGDLNLELADFVDPSVMSLSSYATQSDATSVPCGWLLLDHDYSDSMNTTCVKDRKPRNLYSGAGKGMPNKSYPADLRTTNGANVWTSGASELVVPKLTTDFFGFESSSPPKSASYIYLESPAATKSFRALTEAEPSLDVRLSGLTVASSGPTNRSIDVFSPPYPLLVSPSLPPSVLLTAKSSSRLPASDRASSNSRSPLSLITNTQPSPPLLSNNSINAVSSSLLSGGGRLSGRVSENSMMALLSVSGLSGFDAWKTMKIRRWESFDKWRVPGPGGDSENEGADSSVPLTEGPGDGVYGVGLAA